MCLKDYSILETKYEYNLIIVVYGKKSTMKKCFNDCFIETTSSSFDVFGNDNCYIQVKINLKLNIIKNKTKLVGISSNSLIRNFSFNEDLENFVGINNLSTKNKKKQVNYDTNSKDNNALLISFTCASVDSDKTLLSLLSSISKIKNINSSCNEATLSNKEIKSYHFINLSSKCTSKVFNDIINPYLTNNSNSGTNNKNSIINKENIVLNLNSNKNKNNLNSKLCLGQEINLSTEKIKKVISHQQSTFQLYHLNSNTKIINSDKDNREKTNNLDSKSNTSAACTIF